MTNSAAFGTSGARAGITLWQPVILAFFLIAMSNISPAKASEWITLGDRGLRAILYKPAGKGPFPAIVGLHGCAGPASRSGTINPRDADWARRLQGAGFMVVFPDSFGSRGLGSQCGTRNREIRAADRTSDAFAAARWLAERPDVHKNRIGLIGWSNGGSTALYAAQRGSSGGVGFKQIVAFYPGCRAIGGFSPAVPTTILHGLADDWTPAAPCQALSGVRFIGYPGAHHDFDHPNMPIKQREAAFSADGSGVVTMGTHEPSRAKAIGVVMAIFRGM